MENALNEILEELRGIKFFPFTIPKRDNTREKVCENPNNKIYAFCLGKARQYNRKYLVDCARNKRYSKLLTKLRTGIYPKGEILREELDYFKYHHIL